MALSGPGFDQGGRLKQLVSLVDMPPTLLDAAGLPVPDSMQGHSILPLLNGRTEGWQEEAFIQISESQCGRAIRTARWKYGVDAPGKGGNDSHSETYAEQYLYDMEADPYEQRNVIQMDTLESVRAEMRQRLIKRIREAEGREAKIIPTEITGAGQMYKTARKPLEYR
jgi:arylsulfatase A-like enzyme